VSSPPDASKVHVVGPGVVDGIIDVYQSWFKVDTLGAGGGELIIKMRGPRGQHTFFSFLSKYTLSNIDKGTLMFGRQIAINPGYHYHNSKARRTLISGS